MSRAAAVFLACLMLAGLAGAVPSRVGSMSVDKISAPVSQSVFSHTTVTGTDVLYLFIGLEGGEDVDGLGTATFGSDTFGDSRWESAASGSNNDTRTFVYAISNPTIQTADITIDFTSSVNPAVLVAVNYQGVDVAKTGSCSRCASTREGFGTADTVVNDLVTNATAFSALPTGTDEWDGDSLQVWGAVFQGADGNPASWSSTSCTEIQDDTTGGSGASDFSFAICEENANPANTTTWTVTDENSGVNIQIYGLASARSRVVVVSELRMPDPASELLAARVAELQELQAEMEASK